MAAPGYAWASNLALTQITFMLFRIFQKFKSIEARMTKNSACKRAYRQLYRSV